MRQITVSSALQCTPHPQKRQCSDTLTRNSFLRSTTLNEFPLCGHAYVRFYYGSPPYEGGVDGVSPDGVVLPHLVVTRPACPRSGSCAEGRDRVHAGR